jgi:hypothetical protein
MWAYASYSGDHGIRRDLPDNIALSQPRPTHPDQYRQNQMTQVETRQMTRFDSTRLTCLPILRIRIPTAETNQVKSSATAPRHGPRSVDPFAKPSKKPRIPPRTRLTTQRPRGDRAHPNDHRHAFPHPAFRPQVCARSRSLPQGLWRRLEGDEDPCEREEGSDRLTESIFLVEVHVA